MPGACGVQAGCSSMVALLRYAMTVSRPATSVVLAIVTLAGLAGTGLTYLVGQVVGAAGGLADGAPVGHFAFLLSAMLLVFILNGALPVVWMTAVVTLEMRLDRTVSVQLAEDLFRPYRVEHLDDPVVQDAYAHSREEAPVAVRLGPTFAAQVLQGVIGSVTAAILIGVLFTWWVPIPLALSAALATWYFSWVIDTESDLLRGQTEDQRRASYLFDIGMVGGTKEIRIFGLSDWLTDGYRTARRIAMARVWRKRWSGLTRDIAVMLPHVALSAGMIVYAISEAYRGRLPLASVVAVVPAIVAMSLGFEPWLLGQARKAAASLRSLQRLSRLIEERYPETGTRSVDLSKAPQDAIRFESVGFAYPGSDQHVLHGLDLEIRANEALALVGVNGAGKSTLVKLLAGGYRPTSGRITVDGVDLATVDSQSLGVWQRRLATIGQNFLELPLTVRENIVLSGDDSPQVAARAAGVEDLIEDLPQSWSTVLDKTFPGGVNLSGGQWQRIALARALFAAGSGAGVLVLDEPAAAMDIRSEAALVDSYLSLTAGVTSLIISHRFSVVRGAHRICVLGAGTILESGTHEELLERDGDYARMFRLQASRYLAAGDDHA